MLPLETVTVQRTGEILRGLVDPSDRKLFLSPGADVQAGDVTGFRGYTRRIVVMPQVWHLAGVVAEFEDGPAYLPDLGQLLRPGDGAVLNETTGELDPAASDPLWTGPCKVEPTESDGSTPEIGEQAIGKVPFVITVPLSVVNVQPGDLFRVSSSRDTRLTTRTFTLRAIRASSTSLDRELLGFDPQD